MNRNEQESNEQNRRYHLARRQERYREEPERMHSRERMRHNHDQNLEHNFHNRDKSYRARQEDQVFRKNLSDSGWSNTPGGELSWEEQYRTDGEAHNYKGPLANFEADFDANFDARFDEYPQTGHNLDHRIPRHRDFSGMGPRGYKRSDARIREELCELLSRDHYIDASDIVVAVDNGIVKLSGSVNQREDRVEAEMLAESIIGVEDIQNDISVNRKRRQEMEM